MVTDEQHTLTRSPLGAGSELPWHPWSAGTPGAAISGQTTANASTTASTAAASGFRRIDPICLMGSSEYRHAAPARANTRQRSAPFRNPGFPGADSGLQQPVDKVSPASCCENAVAPGRRQPGWRAGQGTPVFRPAPPRAAGREGVLPTSGMAHVSAHTPPGRGTPARERRPPVGTARERETSADDAALCQLEFRTPFQSRMPRSLTAPPTRGRAFFMPGGVYGRTRS